ncbi:MAG: hypothetical protein JWP91_3789 [Fibrobacteres bacterium]|nr:hypothetical protein [Fibrobacterota bacterium]
MKPSLIRSAILTVALGLSLAGSALAGLTMIQTWQKLDGTSQPTFNTIRMDKDRVRIETASTPDTYFIYRGDKKAFYTINMKEKNYLEMTEKDFQEMSAKMDEAMKKMKAQMEKMPPEQKKMMEGLMAKMAPGGADAPKTSFKKVGAGGKVNGWNTDKYEGIREGAKHSEIWTTAPKSMDIADADVQVLKDMAKFFEKFTKNMEGMIGDKSRNGLDGIPVKTVTFTDGKPTFQSEMKEVKKEAQAADLFEIPAGLTMKKMSKAQ